MTEFAQRPGGVLFDNTKKMSPNAPDKNGTLTLDPALMPYLQALAQSGQPLTLELAAWSKQSSKGTTYLSLAAKQVRTQQQPGSDTGRQPYRAPPQQVVQKDEDDPFDPPF